jgi:hypothetical protein
MPVNALVVSATSAGNSARALKNPALALFAIVSARTTSVLMVKPNIFSYFKD